MHWVLLKTEENLDLIYRIAQMFSLSKMIQAKDEMHQIIKILPRVFVFAQGLTVGVENSCRLSKTFEDG